MTGEEWVDAFCKERNLEWEKLSTLDHFRITQAVPCSIRCWRIGGAVDTTPGKPCPECGRPVPLMTSWEKIPLDV